MIGSRIDSGDRKTFWPDEADAKAVAESNTRDDPHWTYEVRALGTGFVVVVLDEHNDTIGYL